MHQFLNIYAKDQECDSSGSGDLSITDSGRGPSEEGENNDHGKILTVIPWNPTEPAFYS